MAENITTQTTVTNGYHGPEKKRALKILIVGAGIGGLTAAIGLRRQGHHVEVSN
jgi:monoamine oxidase